jgi:hypothetical protein
MPTFRMPFRMPTFNLPTFRMPTFNLPTFRMPPFRMPFRMPTFNLPTFRMPPFRIEPHEWEILWEVLGMEDFPEDFYGIYSRWLVLGGIFLLFVTLTYMWICSMVAYLMGYSFAICYGVGV